jgi:DNA-binding transcriptional regulator YbjK
MSYAPNSQTLSSHRGKLLEIALRHAADGGIKSLNRARIADEAGVSAGVVSIAFGGRDAMIDLVMRTAQDRGITLSFK